jgi:hypothetical protein
MSKRSKNSTTSSENSKPSEKEWIAADDGVQSTEPRVERDPIDEPELDVHQPSPDEVVWVPAGPRDASGAVDEPRVAKKAPRAAGAKPARVGGKARKGATNDVANEAASANDAPAPSASERTPKRAPKRSATQPEAAEVTSTQGDTAARKGALAEEHAAEVVTAATKPSAPAPVTKKRKLQEFVERADQRARERADESALQGAADLAADHSLERADDAQRPAPVPVAKRKRAKAASEQPGTTSPVGESEPPAPSDVAAAAQAEAQTEPSSTLQSMEDYVAELATMSVAQLSKRHVEVLGKNPRIKNKTWLQRKLAWHEQTKRYGGLSVAAKRKLDELMGEIELPVPTSRTPKADAPATKSADDLPLGTRLERKWHDRAIVATRVEGGWSCEGTIHRTLSAAAKAVTQSHVSGPAFFGLWRPKGGAR